jgi:replication factor C subunit 1
VMDEVDGVGGGDRGGLSALLPIVKKTKVPIILICNDRSDRRIQSLLNHSFDVKFTQPTAQQIFKRVSQIVKLEKAHLDYGHFQDVCASSGNDIRQILNVLQLEHTSHKTNNLLKKDKVQMLDNF